VTLADALSQTGQVAFVDFLFETFQRLGTLWIGQQMLWNSTVNARHQRAVHWRQLVSINRLIHVVRVALERNHRPVTFFTQGPKRCK